MNITIRCLHPIQCLPVNGIDHIFFGGSDEITFLKRCLKFLAVASFLMYIRYLYITYDCLFRINVLCYALRPSRKWGSRGEGREGGVGG